MRKVFSQSVCDRKVRFTLEKNDGDPRLSYEMNFDVRIKTRSSFDHNNFIARRFSELRGN